MSRDFSGQRISQILNEARQGIPLPLPEKKQGEPPPYKPTIGISSSKLVRHATDIGNAMSYGGGPTQGGSNAVSKVVQVMLDIEDTTQQLRKMSVGSAGAGPSSSAKSELFWEKLNDATPKIDRAVKQIKSLANTRLPAGTENDGAGQAHVRQNLEQSTMDLSRLLGQLLSDYATLVLSRAQSTTGSSSSTGPGPGPGPGSSQPTAFKITLLLARHILKLQLPSLQVATDLDVPLSPLTEQCYLTLFATQQLHAITDPSVSSDSLTPSLGPAANESLELLILSGVEAVLEIVAVVAARVPQDLRRDLSSAAALLTAPVMQPAATIFSSMLLLHSRGAEEGPTADAVGSGSVGRGVGGAISSCAGGGGGGGEVMYPSISDKGLKMLLEAAALGCATVVRCAAAPSSADSGGGAGAGASGGSSSISSSNRRRLLVMPTVAVLADILRSCHCHVDLAVQAGVLPSTALDISAVTSNGNGTGSGSGSGGLGSAIGIVRSEHSAHAAENEGVGGALDPVVAVMPPALRDLHESLGFVAVPAVQALRLLSAESSAR